MEKPGQRLPQRRTLMGIEFDLFPTQGFQAVMAFALADATLTIAMAPWVNLSEEIRRSFHAVHLVSREVLDDDVPPADEPALPWVVIGMDAYEQGNDRWRFVLNCQEIEYIWDSEWPT